MHTDTEASPAVEVRLNAIHTELIRRARASGEPETAWLYLEAAHVVGQQRLWPHTLTHVHMLRLALRTGDAVEALGQAMRLALVPLGHLSGRLPLGNPGRATVSAFASLPLRPELRALIEQVRSDAAL
ncbi:MAG: hypothetical protein CVU22_20480 [Betaproteobacteria bacterium HGW-Betaproteobacteria-16]|nr:MAG: hypothetical protein CVU22_20480 [Betaproteobacteria bacterium HGW-Betaproteobacteria-16]